MIIHLSCHEDVSLKVGLEAWALIGPNKDTSSPLYDDGDNKKDDNGND